MVSAMYIIGFPTDTEETINNTIDYAKSLNTSFAQFSVGHLIPALRFLKNLRTKYQFKNMNHLINTILFTIIIYLMLKKSDFF